MVKRTRHYRIHSGRAYNGSVPHLSVQGNSEEFPDVYMSWIDEQVRYVAVFTDFKVVREEPLKR